MMDVHTGSAEGTVWGDPGCGYTAAKERSDPTAIGAGSNRSGSPYCPDPQQRPDGLASGHRVQPTQPDRNAERPLEGRHRPQAQIPQLLQADHGNPGRPESPEHNDRTRTSRVRTHCLTLPLGKGRIPSPPRSMQQRCVRHPGDGRTKAPTGLEPALWLQPRIARNLRRAPPVPWNLLPRGKLEPLGQDQGPGKARRLQPGIAAEEGHLGLSTRQELPACSLRRMSPRSAAHCDITPPSPSSARRGRKLCPDLLRSYQLCNPQTPESRRLAEPQPALPRGLNPDPCVVAEQGRPLLPGSFRPTTSRRPFLLGSRVHLSGGRLHRQL